MRKFLVKVLLLVSQFAWSMDVRAEIFTCIERGQKVLRSSPCDGMQEVPKQPPVKTQNTVEIMPGRTQGYMSPADTRDPIDSLLVDTIARASKVGNRASSNLINESTALLIRYREYKANANNQIPTLADPLEKTLFDSARKSIRTGNRAGGMAFIDSMSLLIDRLSKTVTQKQRDVPVEARLQNNYGLTGRFEGSRERDGYTTIRNPDGKILRGYVDRDGYGTLRDDQGNTYKYHRR